MTSDRFEAIETAVAHAEAMIDDLSSVIQAQGAEIDALTRKIAKLSRTLEAALERADEDPPANQPPPHY
ncbi:MAG: SlyX family protein [Pseudomonadota bacterium]